MLAYLLLMALAQAQPAAAAPADAATPPQAAAPEELVTPDIRVVGRPPRCQPRPDLGQPQHLPHHPLRRRLVAHVGFAQRPRRRLRRRLGRPRRGAPRRERQEQRHPGSSTGETGSGKTHQLVSSRHLRARTARAQPRSLPSSPDPLHREAMGRGTTRRVVEGSPTR